MKNQPSYCFSLIGVLVLSACASQPKGEVPLPAATLAREPSPVDPLKPPTVKILGLAEGSLLETGPVRFQLDVLNYPVDKNWQGAVVVLNDLTPGKTIYKSGDFVEFKDGLKEGTNLVRAYLIRSTGESLKNPESVASVSFNVKKKGSQNSGPSLLINSPHGTYSGEAARKILFDFVVSGTQINTRKHRIHYTLNGEKRELTSWESYYFQNLPAGSYTLQIELVDGTGKILKGDETSATSTFTIEK